MHLPHVTPFAAQPLYFFTACLAGRRAVLATEEAVGILEGMWRNSELHDGWFVGRYVIVPDHVHFFAMPNAKARPRAEWCNTWKSVSSRHLAKRCGMVPPIWQADTFDHILRSPDSYSAKWDYVRANPVRARLVAAADDWPWRGEIHALAFRC